MPKKPIKKTKLKTAITATALPYAVEKALLLGIQEVIEMVKGGDESKKFVVRKEITAGEDEVVLRFTVVPGKKRK